MGQTKERKLALTMGLGIVMTKSDEDFEDDQAEKAGASAGPA